MVLLQEIDALPEASSVKYEQPEVDLYLGTEILSYSGTLYVTEE
jgi:hypothetical protein